MRPLAWEHPYATGAALEKTERQKKKKKVIYLKLNVMPGNGVSARVSVIGVFRMTDEQFKSINECVSINAPVSIGCNFCYLPLIENITNNILDSSSFLPHPHLSSTQ